MKSFEDLQLEATKVFDDQVVDLFRNDPKMNCRKAATLLKTGYFNVYCAFIRRGIEISETKQGHR